MNAHVRASRELPAGKTLMASHAPVTLHAIRRGAAEAFVRSFVPQEEQASSETLERVRNAVALLPPPEPAVLLHEAVLCADGHTLFHIEPAGSHAEILDAMKANGARIKGACKGFMTSHHTFVDREEAFRVGFKAEQKMVAALTGKDALLVDSLA